METQQTITFFGTPSATQPPAHLQERPQVHRFRSLHHLRPQLPDLSLQHRCLRQAGPLRQATPGRHSHKAGRPGAVSAKQHRQHPTPHRNLRATGNSGRSCTLNRGVVYGSG